MEETEDGKKDILYRSLLHAVSPTGLCVSCTELVCGCSLTYCVSFPLTVLHCPLYSRLKLLLHVIDLMRMTKHVEAVLQLI